jgi:hypothetical protein
MREIKFRAVVIDDDGQERLEYNVWPTGPSPGMTHLRGFVDNGGFWMDCKRFEQFTGFKDVNGKYIFEGDILISSWDEYYVVLWEGSGWKIKPKRHKPTPMKGSRHRIIGNIYENPDLV